MHIVIGGAANGKRAYVKERTGETAHWLGDGSPLDLHDLDDIPADVPLVIVHIEQWLAERLENEQAAIEEFLKAVRTENTTLILTDIGRGIVPINAEERALRDACGRLNQHLVKQADTVTRIWYGIPQQLKVRGEFE